MIPLHWFQANKTNKELPNSNTQGADFEVAGENQGSSLAWCGSSTKLETGKTLAKGGNGYWKSIGLGFKTPCEAIEEMENSSGSARAKLMKLSDKESLVEDDSTALVPGEQNEQRASEQNIQGADLKVAGGIQRSSLAWCGRFIVGCTVLDDFYDPVVETITNVEFVKYVSEILHVS
ncbi:hypothetical protein OROMI_017912 [Orobanche minor]